MMNGKLENAMSLLSDVASNWNQPALNNTNRSSSLLVGGGSGGGGGGGGGGGPGFEGLNDVVSTETPAAVVHGLGGGSSGMGRTMTVSVEDVTIGVCVEHHPSIS